MDKCETCLEGRCVVSENGFHYNCCLKEKDAIDCLMGRADHYVKNPMKKTDDE